MFKKFVWLSLAFIFIALFACTPKPSSVALESKKEKESIAIPVEKASWEVEWEKTIKEAKKEGTVVIYTSAGSTLRASMQKGFKNRYGVDTEFLTGRGEELTAKLKAERSSGLYLADLFIGGSTIPLALMKPYGQLDKLEPLLLLPEVTDPKVWWGGRLRWLDKDRTSLPFTGWPVAPIVVNSNVIKPDEIKSYRDLLNPKLKGKIVIDDPTVTGSGAKTISVMGRITMGWDFVRELAKQEPVIERDIRLAFDGLARGKYALAMGVKPEIVKDFQQAGIPLEWVTPKEGTYLASGSGVISAYNRMPHPNAARLFVNWLLSKEGQTIFIEAYGVPSARLDVPTTGLDPLLILKPGVKYIIADDEEFMVEHTKDLEINKEIFRIKR